VQWADGQTFGEAAAVPDEPPMIDVTPDDATERVA
jgi:hypothetical protein